MSRFQLPSKEVSCILHQFLCGFLQFLPLNKWVMAVMFSQTLPACQQISKSSSISSIFSRKRPNITFSGPNPKNWVSPSARLLVVAPAPRSRTVVGSNRQRLAPHRWPPKMCHGTSKTFTRCGLWRNKSWGKICICNMYVCGCMCTVCIYYVCSMYIYIYSIHIHVCIYAISTCSRFAFQKVRTYACWYCMILLGLYPEELRRGTNLVNYLLAAAFSPPDGHELTTKKPCPRLRAIKHAAEKEGMDVGHVYFHRKHPNKKMTPA